MDSTFALLKPDTALQPSGFAIIEDILARGLRLTAMRQIVHPSPADVESFLSELKVANPEAYDRNFPHLCRGPLVALRFTGIDPVKTLRDLVGCTDPAAASPGTLRATYGKDTLASATAEGRGLRNAIHAADSPESVEREGSIWFPHWHLYGV
jgi:nucleoside-diphosphate kinase